MLFEKRSLHVSLLLHFGLLLVAFFGLPALLPDDPEPQPLVMTVELLPISAMTNVKPSDKPIQKEQKAPVKTPVKEPTPPNPTPPKPQPKVEEPEDKPFDPDEGEVVEKKKPKEEKQKETPKQEKTEDDFEKLLADLQKQSEKPAPKAKDSATTEENKTKSDAPYDETMPLSLSEEDAIKNAFIPCWSPPAGAKDAANLIVVLRAQYNTTTGALIDAKLDSSLSGRYGSDPFFRAAADSAMRAVKHPRCNPLKLPPALYPKLRDTKLTFDPRAML